MDTYYKLFQIFVEDAGLNIEENHSQTHHSQSLIHNEENHSQSS